MGAGMTKFQEPETVDPRDLVAGDQVGCTDSGNRLQVMTGGLVDSPCGLDEIWMTLCNNPGETTHVWDQPVPHGNVALDLADHGWKVNALPRVWARRAIA